MGDFCDGRGLVVEALGGGRKGRPWMGSRRRDLGEFGAKSGGNLARNHT